MIYSILSKESNIILMINNETILKYCAFKIELWNLITNFDINDNKESEKKNGNEKIVWKQFVEMIILFC